MSKKYIVFILIVFSFLTNGSYLIAKMEGCKFKGKINGKKAKAFNGEITTAGIAPYLLW